jgi:hypothetical protein
MLKPLDATVLEKSLQLVTDAFVNASFAAVKTPDLREAILKKLEAEFTPKGALGIDDARYNC